MYNSDTKQLNISNRTFDIIPTTIQPRNLNLERGMFNQVSGLEYKNPDKFNQIKETLQDPHTNNYKNPYAICHNDFCENIFNDSRKSEKTSRTNIFNERLQNKSRYINQLNMNNKPYIDRFEEEKIKSNKLKTQQPKKNPLNLSFEEYLQFKRNQKQYEGNPKY